LSLIPHIGTFIPSKLVVFCIAKIAFVTLDPVSTWMGDRPLAGRPPRYVTSHLGQLSLPSLRGRSIEYWLVWLGLRWGVFTCVGWQVTLCDPIWQVTVTRSCIVGYVPLTAIQYFQRLHLMFVTCCSYLHIDGVSSLRVAETAAHQRGRELGPRFRPLLHVRKTMVEIVS